VTLHRVCPVCAVSCGNPSALDHLPESVAGAAVFDPIVHLGASGTCDFLHRVCPACVVSRGSPRPLRLLHRVCPALRGVPCYLSAVGHLPESVAGAAVFDPMPRVGSAVGSNEAQLRCHPMVHEGRCKHPALHLRHHLQVRLTRHPGGRHNIRCRLPSSKLFV
jgi:hypothetical protein